MAAKKKNNSIEALAAKAIDQIKRGPGRPKGSTAKVGRKKAGRNKSSECVGLAEVRNAVSTIKKVKTMLKEVDSMGVMSTARASAMSGSTSSPVKQGRGRPKKK